MEKKEIIIGRNPVLEYLSSIEDCTGVELHLSSTAHGKIIADIQNICKRKKVKVVIEDKLFFKDISSSSKHQGVILYVPIKKQVYDRTDLLKKIAEEKGVVVLLDQITDPHNLGSIIRTAEAFGCKAVILSKDNSADVNETVVKTSAGATAHIEIITVVNVAQFLEDIKKMGFWIIGTSDKGTVSIKDHNNLHNNLHPACIIIGSEGKGMRRLTGEHCDYIVSIPLKGHVSSLNASVAAGIVLYEIMKGDVSG
ncbi:MAG: 23S rRNA (guanosine(2251)-2'-O)-methyltransferase RlmB [Spirochaetes bacterium]|nr:23S rRNA (guanosine(2251)-2'-O)-methyltransferase RlmB [Spirochaetota bacterium]